MKGKKVINIGTTINSHSYLQGNNSLYTKLALDYGIGNFISAGIFIGHQVRDYSFFQFTKILVSIHKNIPRGSFLLV